MCNLYDAPQFPQTIDSLPTSLHPLISLSQRHNLHHKLCSEPEQVAVSLKMTVIKVTMKMDFVILRF